MLSVNELWTAARGHRPLRKPMDEHEPAPRHLEMEVPFHRHAFRIRGCAGVVLACALSGWLAVRTHLSLRVMAAIIVLSIVTFLALAMARKMITGQEALTYYHHQLGVLAAAALLLRVLDQPAVPYLDVTVLGVGMFLACGRFGCLLVGCCHGCPWRWGVKYSDEHARIGFTSHLVGVRLFPVQAVESLAVLSIVVVGVSILMRRSPPGTALAWYVVSYGVVRFCLEFLRGDAERPYWLGFSEAQWTSLILMSCVVWAEYSRALAFHLGHFLATLGIAAAMIAIALFRSYRKTPMHQLLHPRHVREFSEAVALVSRFATERPAYPGNDSTIHIAHTSLGIRISAGFVRSGTKLIRHYTLSSEKNPMTTQAANCLAKLILRLRCTDGSAEVVQRSQGVFHVLTAAAATD